MSIWADHAIKELQEKVAWLEREVTEWKQAAQRALSVREEMETTLAQANAQADQGRKVLNGTLQLKRK